MPKSLVRPLHNHSDSPARVGPAMLAALVTTAMAAGCALFPPSALEQSRERVQTLEAERDLLLQQNDRHRKEVARLQLEALDKNARITALEAELQRRDRELEEARARLLRIDSRSQAFTGPAQAAAVIAEAEAAFHVAATRDPMELKAEAAREIGRLLQEGTQAYEAGDYARAAALADRVLRRLSPADVGEPPANHPSASYPEHPLENPVVFRVRVQSHVRRGPGMGFAATAVVPAGREVTGIATRGQWVKIRGPEEVRGWIFRTLLAVPE